MLLIGIHDRFTYERRNWIVKDIINQNWICETTDNGKKAKLEKRFTKNDMIKISIKN